MSEERSNAPARWDPFAEFDALREWEPFRGVGWGLPRLARMSDPAVGVARGSRFAPPVSIAESDAAYNITVELPGTKRDDVTVEVHDNVLTIRGEKRSEREDENEHHRYVERSFGSFSRSFTLPANAEADRVAAGFKDGVLTIQIPKAEEKKPRVVRLEG